MDGGLKMSSVASLYPSRIAALRSKMKENDVDALIVSATSDMLYLIGRKLPNTERFNALILGQTGNPYLVVPELQYPLVASLVENAEIITWAETTDPIRVASDLLHRLDARSVAVDGLMRGAFLLRLQERVGRQVRFSDGTPLTAQVRLLKDADEIVRLTDAGGRFDAIWEAFWKNGRLVGVSEREVVEQIRKLLFAHGFDTMEWCDVGSGPNGASPLHHHSDRIIQPGDPVVIDFAGTIGGYFMDTCRTPVAGTPLPGFIEIHEITRKAHEAANERARPGIAAGDVDQAARDVIAKAGYGERFMHRLGHGLGLDAHEEPYIIAANRLRLQPGMVYSNEPGIYIDGKWGVRIEDIILMTSDGARSLNSATRDLVSMN